MNQFIRTQIQHAITMTEVFKESCRIAAIADGGGISREEEKTLKRINDAADRYVKELQKIG